MNTHEALNLGQRNPSETGIGGTDKAKISVAEKVRIIKEQEGARERFKDLIDMVSARYENLPEKMREEFVAHNEEILNGAVELGIRNGFSEEELEQLELSAILHDMTKADPVPEKFKEIGIYNTVMHGKMAAEEAPKVLTDDRLGQYFGEADFEEIRKTVSRAILEHMGPRPGFMSYMVKDINAKFREMNEPEIEYPEAEGKISEVLLAADMKSLAGTKGRKKVLAIRSSAPSFRKQDEAKSLEYKSYGVELGPEEAALLSGFQSAYEARDMIKDPKNQDWINEAIEESIAYEYDLGDSKITGKEVLAKKAQFEKMVAETTIH